MQRRRRWGEEEEEEEEVEEEEGDLSSVSVGNNREGWKSFFPWSDIAGSSTCRIALSSHGL